MVRRVLRIHRHVAEPYEVAAAQTL